MKGNLFIISSPSGGGKGTLIKELLKAVSEISYSVSYTTRGIRKGEIDGKDYFFVSADEFERLIAEGEFLEYAVVHDHYYGTSISQVKKDTLEGKDIILEIDVQGAKTVREKMPSAVGIFILPPSYEVLSNRLIDRSTESEESLIVRLNNAKKEVTEFANFDYIIVNNEMKRASDGLNAIFISERLKRNRQTDNIRDILNSFDDLTTR